MKIRATTLLLSMPIAGCAASSQPAREPVAVEQVTSPVRAPSSRERMQVTSELGEIDQSAVERSFRQAQPNLLGCFKEGLGRVEYLSGDVAFLLRIDAQGHARYALLERSSLGDYEAERCMRSVLEGMQWPVPDGGEAEVKQSLSFDAPGDVRPPVKWHPDKVAAALARDTEKFEKCKAGDSARFTVTAYVEPDGRNGRIQSVGVSVANKSAAEKLDCIVDGVRSLRLPSPGSYAAKVSFVL